MGVRRNSGMGRVRERSPVAGCEGDALEDTERRNGRKILEDNYLYMGTTY